MQQHLQRLQRQTGQSAHYGPSSFGFHPASPVFNSFPVLSALVTADWKNAHGQHIF